MKFDSFDRTREETLKCLGTQWVDIKIKQKVSKFSFF